MSRALAQRTGFYDVWRKFVVTGSPEGLPENISASWRRCHDMGFNPRAEVHLTGIEEDVIQRRINEHVDLCQLLKAHHKDIEKYFDFLPLAILFSDRDGYLLSVSGHDEILELLARGNVKAGTSINEKVIGTTAPGICLEEGRPSSVIAEEHYFQGFHWASCIATPIIDQTRNQLFTLDFTSTVEHGEKLSRLIPFLHSIANSIKFELGLKQKLQHLEFCDSYFHSTFDYSDSVLILVNKRGYVIDLNIRAQDIVKISPDQIRNRHVGMILGNEGKINALLKRSCVEKIAFQHDTESRAYSVKPIPIFDQFGNEIAFLMKLEEVKTAVAVPGGIRNAARHTWKSIIGKSNRIVEVISRAKKAAKTQSNILIEGETGTGKELFAQSIHNESSRSGGPFVALNCSAIPHDLIESELFGYDRGAYTGARKEGNLGKFEMANGGTIFLDEIHSMDLSAQMKMLRVIEDRRVMRIGGKSQIPLDIRVIAASTKNLENEIERGTFLSPLYFRLNVVRLYIPSLKERKEDIPLLIDHFIEEMNDRFNRSICGIETEAIEYLSQYSWPGNVRELRNCFECAFNFVEEGMISLSDLNLKLPACSVDEALTGHGIKEITKRLVVEALNRTDHTREAAKLLGISVSTLYRWIKNFGLNRPSKN
jgi:transcriptional regulator with PAS, ATPase and Fis domain